MDALGFTWAITVLQSIPYICESETPIVLITIGQSDLDVKTFETLRLKYSAHWQAHNGSQATMQTIVVESLSQTWKQRL